MKLGEYYKEYAYGHCWDTGALSCGRSVMAYQGCETPNGQSDCSQLDVFSDPTSNNGALSGQAYGIMAQKYLQSVVRKSLSRESI